jgi:hypothetical protein
MQAGICPCSRHIVQLTGKCPTSPLIVQMDNFRIAGHSLATATTAFEVLLGYTER